VVVDCSLLSLVLILRDKEGRRRIDDNHNHDYSNLPNYDSRCSWEY
jgi:hypothetical protein